MQKNIKILSIALLAILLFGFTKKYEINQCYISFRNLSTPGADTVERLPENAPKSRKLTTEHGDVAVSRVDGYRVTYRNNKKVPFINMKVELSDHKQYQSDKKNVLANLRYLCVHSVDMETKDLVELKFNGFTIYGFNRNTIEKGAVMASFVLFTKEDVIVYFNFNNLPTTYRHYESLEDYKKKRDLFLDEYTKHLKRCMK